MNLKHFLALGVLLISVQVFAQSLTGGKIWKIQNRKLNFYQTTGVFHNGNEGSASNLRTIRHSYNKEIKAERIVFDFAGDRVPRIYGHISPTQDKIYIDMFNTDTDVANAVDASGDLLKNVTYYKISKDILSVELNFKNKINADVFFLESPGRLVIDIKK